MTTILSAFLFGIWASSATAEPEYIRESTEVNFSNSERFWIATGEIYSYALSGRYQVEIIDRHEVILRVLVDNGVNQNSDPENLRQHVDIVQWMHSGFDRLVGRRVLIVFDRENENAPVRMLYAQEVFCMDEDVFFEEEWDVLNVGNISAGCFEFSQ